MARLADRLSGARGEIRFERMASQLRAFEKKWRVPTHNFLDEGLGTIDVRCTPSGMQTMMNGMGGMMSGMALLWLLVIVVLVLAAAALAKYLFGR